MFYLEVWVQDSSGEGGAAAKGGQRRCPSEQGCGSGEAESLRAGSQECPGTVQSLASLTSQPSHSSGRTGTAAWVVWGGKLRAVIVPRMQNAPMG